MGKREEKAEVARVENPLEEQEEVDFQGANKPPVPQASQGTDSVEEESPVDFQ